MRKLSNEEINKIREKLIPFWKAYKKLQEEFYRQEQELINEMNKKTGLGIDLIFFRVDGEVVGIGAEDLFKRDNFPLIYFEDI